MLQVPPRQPPSPRRPRRPMSAPAAVLGHHLPRDKAARPSVKVTFSSDPARTPLRRVRPPGVNSGHPPEAAPLRHRPPQGHRAAAAGRKAARNTPEEPSHERAPLRARRPAPPTTAGREHRACPTAAPSRRPSSDASALLWAQGQGADQGLPLPPRQAAITTAAFMAANPLASPPPTPPAAGQRVARISSGHFFSRPLWAPPPARMDAGGSAGPSPRDGPAELHARPGAQHRRRELLSGSANPARRRPTCARRSAGPVSAPLRTALVRRDHAAAAPSCAQPLREHRSRVGVGSRACVHRADAVAAIVNVLCSPLRGC